MAKNFRLGSDDSAVDFQLSNGGIIDKNSSLGTNGQFLQTDGTNISWGDVSVSGTLTFINNDDSDVYNGSVNKTITFTPMTSEEIQALFEED